MFGPSLVEHQPQLGKSAKFIGSYGFARVFVFAVRGRNRRLLELRSIRNPASNFFLGRVGSCAHVLSDCLISEFDCVDHTGPINEIAELWRRVFEDVSGEVALALKPAADDHEFRNRRSDSVLVVA